MDWLVIFLTSVQTKALHYTTSGPLTWERNIETRRITIFFFNNILSSKCLTFIFILGNTQNSFSCGWNSGSFWSAKYLNLGQKLTICAVHHTFLEERHPEDTKNPFFWSPEVSRKFLSFDRLLNILMLKRYHWFPEKCYWTCKFNCPGFLKLSQLQNNPQYFESF